MQGKMWCCRLHMLHTCPACVGKDENGTELIIAGIEDANPNKETLALQAAMILRMYAKNSRPYTRLSKPGGRRAILMPEQAQTWKVPSPVIFAAALEELDSVKQVELIPGLTQGEN